MNPHIKPDKENALAPTQIHGLSHDGRGIATVNNKKVFIEGALPEETVTYQITQKFSHYQHARVLSIVAPSPQRSAPPCPHFGVCGGCSLQHMSEDLQLLLKQQTLLEQLKHFGNVTPEIILPPLQAATLGYRHKARLGVKFVIKKNKLLVGFREKSSRYLADLSGCLVLHPRVGAQFTLLSEMIASLSCYRHIAQIEMAMGDHDLALVFRHLEPLTASDKEILSAFGAEQNIHIYLQPNPPAEISKLWPADGKEWLTYTLPDYQLEFLFHPLDFTQIHLEMNRLMIKQAIQLLDVKKNDVVLDLFCGIGNFSLPLARSADHVVGVEGSALMVERATRNAKHNDIANVSFYVGNLMEPSLEAAWMKKRYDKILLDPPRAGAKEMLPHLPRSGANTIVYVSCNPATLARDAGELVHQYGYTLKQVGAINMFAHTSHVEAMAVFVKS